MTDLRPRPARGSGRTILRLALADFGHDWKVSACLVLALAAVLVPLLVLFGLKSGIVSTMRDRLLADPRNLEITLVGSYRLQPDWFTALSALPETGFVMPRTRSLAATLDVMGESGRAVSAIELVPTGAGDPLLRDIAPPAGLGDILISRSVAQKLALAEGDGITGLLARSRDGVRDVLRLPLTIRAILPEAVFGRDGAFVTLELLALAEDFRDGEAVSFEAPPQDIAARDFASARLFARDLDAVAPLADRLRRDGIEIRTRANDIETVKAIDRALSFIFSVIAGIAVGGYLLSLASNLWANVERKRRELALMRLVGFSTAAVIAFPAIQALLVALLGAGLSSAVAWGVALSFNASLASNLAGGEFVCRLLPEDLAIAALATALLALLASSIGGYRAARIDPAESLRIL